MFFFFFSSRRRHTRWTGDWSSDVCSSDLDGQDFEKAARLRDDEKRLRADKATRETEWKSGDMDVIAEVDEELIAEVLAASTGIPVFKLTEEESSRLLHMEDELHKRVVGMDDA